MSDTAYVSLAKEYGDDFELIYQQQTSKLLPCVDVGQQEGEDKFEDFIGTVEGEEVSTRHGDSPSENPAHTRRKLSLLTWHAGLFLDKTDRIEMLKDPTNKYSQAMAAGAGRWMDKKILAAIAASVYTGKTGATAITSYASGECRLIRSDGVIETAGSNFTGATETVLTLTKLKTCKQLMDDASVPEGERFFAANSWNWTNMVVDTTITGVEMAAVRDIAKGTLREIMGFTPVILPTSTFTENATDSGCIECVAWQRNALKVNLGVGASSTQVRITERSDKNYSWYLWNQIMAAATRMQGPGVVRILLDMA